MPDTYPIRLPSGGKVILNAPDTFTRADAAHVKRWVDMIALLSEDWTKAAEGGPTQAAGQDSASGHEGLVHGGV